MASIAYQWGQYEMVAEVALPRVVALKNVELQLYLAASLIHLRVPSKDIRWKVVRDEAATTPNQPDSVLVITKYLAGLVNERTFLSQATRPDWRCSVEYFVALKKSSMGDYEGALPLILAAAQGPKGLPPQAWAVMLLDRWSSANARWDQVKARQVI
jgi:hypothetical protein